MNSGSGARRVGETTGRPGARARRRGCAPGGPRASGVRPRLLAEWLEGRLLLSTYTVNSTADVAGTAPNYVGTLRWAVAQADAADAPTSNPSVVAFSSSVFGASAQTITLTRGQLELTAGATTVTGPGANLLAVSGNNAGQVFQVDAAVTQGVLSGLTISGGTAGSGNGGGVSNAGTLAISHCALTGDSARDGGGLYNTGALTLTGSALTGDTGTYGGGINNQGTLTVTDSTLSGDSARTGGGILNDATLTVTASTLSANSADLGGGIYTAGAATLNDTLVAADTSTGGGGDLYTFSGFGLNGSFSGSYDLIGDGTGQTGLVNDTDGTTGNQVGTSSAPLDPKLGPLQNNGGPTQTMALLPGSPAIEAGSNDLTPAGTTTDQRGYIRVANVTVDIGACEFGAAPPALAASPLVVNSAADGTDYTPGTLTLRQAVSLADAANAPASRPTAITFSPSVFGTPQTITLSQRTLAFTGGAATLSGPGAGLLDVYGNNNTDSPFDSVLDVYQVANVTVSGLTISGGNSQEGGGIANEGTLALNDCVVSGNSAQLGGGIYNDYGGALSLVGCTLSGDSATFDGGGGLWNDGTLTAADCTFFSDSAAAGAAGGGMFNDGTATITNSTFYADSTGTGQYSRGGAICNEYQGVLYVYDSTLTDNSSPLGAGIDNYTQATLYNTIVAANTSATGGDLYGDTENGASSAGTFSGSDNLIGDGTGQSGLINNTNKYNKVGTASAPINPRLGPLQNNGGPTETVAPFPGSPAIDAGSNALVPAGVTTDQRGPGYARVANGTVDIGAYEVQPATAAPTVAGVSVDSTAWSSSFPYKASGYPIPTGSAQLADLPWTNLNQVKISFSEGVTVTQASLALTGVNKAGYAVSSFTYDAATFTATWTFASPLAADKLKFDVAATGANAVTATTGGVALDGTFTNASGTFPSGGGTPGTDFVYDLDVLPGDVAQKGGQVNILEVIQTRNAQLTSPGVAGYSPFLDVDGSGTINILDVIAVRNRQLTSLPAGMP